MKRKEYRNRTAVLLSVEKDRWTDFIDLCDKERKSTSLKFSEMLEEELQKNAVGEHNPIRIRYGEAANKPSQSDLRDWLPRNEAFVKAKRMPLDANQWKHIGQTFLIIADRKRTGYL